MGDYIHTKNPDNKYILTEDQLMDLVAAEASIEAEDQGGRVDHEKVYGKLKDYTLHEDADEYHSMQELYDYRLAYNALLFNQWATGGIKHDVHKSWRHSDGELCFGGGWFIVSATMPYGQVTNHYEDKHWPLFDIPVRRTANEWDGHTPDEALRRLLSMAGNRGEPARTVLVIGDTELEAAAYVAANIPCEWRAFGKHDQPKMEGLRIDDWVVVPGTTISEAVQDHVVTSLSWSHDQHTSRE